jgi:hypothetical protein
LPNNGFRFSYSNLCCSETLLIFFAPQVLNFLLSLPQVWSNKLSTPNQKGKNKTIYNSAG